MTTRIAHKDSLAVLKKAPVSRHGAVLASQSQIARFNSFFFMKTKPPKPKRGALSDLAESSGIPYATLSRWKREGTEIFNPNALAERIGRKKDSPPESITAARLDLISAQTEKVRLANQIQRGEFVNAAEIRAEGLQIANTVRSVFLRMENDFPPLLTGCTSAEIKLAVRKYAREKLIELSQHRTQILIQP